MQIPQSDILTTNRLGKIFSNTVATRNHGVVKSYNTRYTIGTVPFVYARGGGARTGTPQVKDKQQTDNSDIVL